MTELTYPSDLKWMEIQDWIDKNSNGDVEVFQEVIYGDHPRYDYVYYRVSFSNSDDALFCKIKYPPEK